MHYAFVDILKCSNQRGSFTAIVLCPEIWARNQLSLKGLSQNNQSNV